MKKSQLTLFSIVILVSVLIFGCSTSDRIEEAAKVINNPDNQIPNSGGSFINDTNETTAGGSIVNDENTTTGTIKIDAKNAYKVSVSFSDEYNQRGYYSKGEVGQLSFDIKNIYTNAAIDTSIIENITLKAEAVEEENQNENVQGTYLNFITFSGAQGGIYGIEEASIKAADSVALKMEDLSGTTNIILEVKIENIDNPFKLKIPIVIEKNKSSSMAMTRIGSSYKNGLFTDKFVIHVVDSYGNKAKDGTNISVGVINNPKLYSNAYNGATQRVADDYNIEINIPDNIYETQTFAETVLDDQILPTRPNSNRIIPYDFGKYYQYLTTSKVVETNETIRTTTVSTRYYQNIFGITYKDDQGNLNKSDSTFTLPIGSIDMSKDTITSLDTLIILANKENHKPTNLGGWDIQNINSDNELSLIGLDEGSDIEGVSYVVGDEYRYIEYGQTIINAAASTFETTDVKDGLAFAELRYVPEMVGKNVFIYANTRLENEHLGISRKILLHGTGLQNETLSCTNTENRRPDCSYSIRIVQNDSGKGAHRVNISQPQIAGEAVYSYATASQTSDTGWTTVSIYGIDENKTATVSFGSLINNEYIINQR